MRHGSLVALIRGYDVYYSNGKGYGSTIGIRGLEPPVTLFHYSYVTVNTMDQKEEQVGFHYRASLSVVHSATLTLRTNIGYEGG